MDKKHVCSAMKFSSTAQVSDSDLKGCKVVTKGKDTFVFVVDRKGFLHILKHDKSAKKLVPYKKLQIHKRGVSAIEFLPQWKGNEIIITSSLDGKALFWKFEDLISDGDITPLSEFNASDNICRIVPLTKQRIALISWDKKTYLINENDEKIILDHGSLPGWDICEFTDVLITANADRSLTIWSNGGNKISEYKDAHSGAVRSIFAYNERVYSIGNDGSIIKWIIQEDKTLKEEKKLQITDVYLYCYDIIDHYCYIGSEDKVIYEVDLNKMELTDVIVTGTTPWCISHENTTDIYTAESKGVVNVFSSSPELRAAEESEESYFASNLQHIT
ncbi:phospholipase A-2-activating protein [Histomonas meleagridis]|uniref:phospholipase A-2-activating protein n=1 Tax=Histomonas meleagridis TaxID=135588 RepID=UPI00355A61F2|nr:phospholipase A-2-activating protein [Histomonas meleagridis]KAH0805161.1 phospholipase A-2-activating protein [Histomonas meleagridis]